MDRLLALRRQEFPDFQSSLPPRFMDRILDRMKNSSDRRGISRRRLERCSSSFAEDLPVSTSFFATRSLQLPDFTVDGETDRINRSPGIIINRFQPQADVLSEVSSSGVDSLDRNTTAIFSENERGEKNVNRNYNGYDREDLFEKCLTSIDVVNLDRFIVTVKEDAGRYFLLATVVAGTDSFLRLEDEGGKTWLFGFSYLRVSQCYEFTKGWRSYVEEKQLKGGDFVFFQRYRKDSSKLFIGCKKSDESFPSAVMNLTSPGASDEMVEVGEKVEEVETPFRPKLPEHGITGSEPILVVYCGDNQVSEEMYFISYIFNKLCLRGFAPLRYDMKMSIVTENQKMIHISRVGVIIFSINFAHSRECLDGFVAIMEHLKTNDLVLIPVFFKVSVSDVRGQSGSFGKAFKRLGSSVQASQVMKWRAAMIELTSITGYAYTRKGDEVILAKNIVRDVCLPLSSETNMKLRGTRLSLKTILSLLNRSQPSAPQIVVLWGTAGIGKTTITRDFFRSQAERYDNLEKLKRIILSHSQKLTKFPRLSKARNLEHIDLEGCTSLVKVNSSILHHDKLTFLSLKNCSRLRVMPTTVHLKSLEVLNLSGCSEFENLQDFSSNLKELYLAGTAIREMPSSIGDLTRLVILDLENCESLQHLPPGISNLKAMMTLKLSGCSNLKSLPVLDALFLQNSQRPNKKKTMEESVSVNLHSAIQEPRLDGSETLLKLDNLQLRSDIHGFCFSREAVEEFLPAFEYLSNNGIPQESWTRVTIILFPPSILHSLASRLYALVSLFLCNAYLVDIPEDIRWLASVMRVHLGGNSFSQIPKSIKEFRKLHSLRLRHCKNLKSLPELPRSLVVLNAHGCVSLKSFPTSFEQFPRHYIFSNCFNLSPKVVRKYIGKAIDSVEGMAKGILQASLEQEHINAPAFSICIPASAGHQSSVNLQAGSSVRIQLAPGMLKTLSGFVLSVVVEFWDSYCNTSGFGIKCICRKSRIDLSPRLERIFHCWAPKEPTKVRRDHMFVFGSVKMHHAEAVNHDFLSDSLTFEFHPVNSENQLLGDSCTVKRCGVYLITDATCNTILSAKRPSSSMDPGELSSMEHVAPPYKRCRLKGVIEIVILSLRKRKREMSVPTVKSVSKVPYVVGPSCSFDHPTWVNTHKTSSSIPSESPRMDMLGLSSYGKPSDKRVETSTETSKRLSVSESRQSTAGKDATDTEQEEDFYCAWNMIKNYRNLEQNEGKALGSHKVLVTETVPNQSNSSLTDSLTRIPKPTQSEARVHQQSFCLVSLDKDDLVKELPSAQLQNTRMAMLKQDRQTVRLRSCNHIVTVPGMSTPPEDLGAEFLIMPKSHKIVFPGLEFGSRVSK
ncbi:hypothetical protein Bca4012_023585 [Brassica carinata]